MASKRLFISYSSEDKTFASKLRVMLQKRGALVFSDAELDLGRPWPEQLRKQIQEASALVLVVPSPSVPDRYRIGFEAGAAKAFGGKRSLLSFLRSGGQSTTCPPSWLTSSFWTPTSGRLRAWQIHCCKRRRRSTRRWG